MYGELGVKYSPELENAILDFDSVRIPVKFGSFASVDATAKLDPLFMERLDLVVNRLLSKNKTVILSFFHYRQITGGKLNFGESEVDELVLEERFVNIWSQLAERYKGYGKKLVFEVYNEPHGRLSGSTWRNLFDRGLKRIRLIDPRRIVIFGADDWSSIAGLEASNPVDDVNVIYTVHVYDPFLFTHQGASWVKPTRPVGVSCCDYAQIALIRNRIFRISRWSKTYGRPVFVGEFGSINIADHKSRIEYTSTFVALAREYRIPWFYWQIASDFGVFDFKSSKWLPGFRDVLLR
ncbi:glycoside hydrolase family 5 protein [Aquabacterium lacunae]|uniref:glycoside hydrolase family 5 protein n=1 Tax=Aquabacterium lacunae TaxID=2528630 RepID=UPI0013EEFDA6|nr:glycoside hydrolase family 5 protein [Aquabacterium lacunae]